MTDVLRVSLVTGLLWALSISSWVVIGYKCWWLWRVRQDLPQARHAFWTNDDAAQACQALTMLDRQALLTALVREAHPECFQGPGSMVSPRLAGAARLRGVQQSLRQAARQVGWGQSWLACVAAAAPFVGLLGTVWGLTEALGSLAFQSGSEGKVWLPALSQVLDLTAAGLLVALPALLAHHLLAPPLEALQQVVEDFAHELMVLLQEDDRGQS